MESNKEFKKRMHKARETQAKYNAVKKKERDEGTRLPKKDN